MKAGFSSLSVGTVRWSFSVWERIKTKSYSRRSYRSSTHTRLGWTTIVLFHLIIIYIYLISLPEKAMALGSNLVKRLASSMFSVQTAIYNKYFTFMHVFLSLKLKVLKCFFKLIFKMFFQNFQILIIITE